MNDFALIDTPSDDLLADLGAPDAEAQFWVTIVCW